MCPGRWRSGVLELCSSLGSSFALYEVERKSCFSAQVAGRCPLGNGGSAWRPSINQPSRTVCRNSSVLVYSPCTVYVHRHLGEYDIRLRDSTCLAPMAGQKYLPVFSRFWIPKSGLPEIRFLGESINPNRIFAYILGRGGTAL